MQGEKVTLTLTLTGCKSGIGVGLDKENKVDMLKPEMPAAKAMVMGDKVVSWNGEEMTRVVGGRIQQRMLKDVVKPGLDTHTVIVERVKKAWSPQTYEADYQQTSEWEQKSSWEDTAGSWG